MTMVSCFQMQNRHMYLCTYVGAHAHTYYKYTYIRTYMQSYSMTVLHTHIRMFVPTHSTLNQCTFKINAIQYTKCQCVLWSAECNCCLKGNIITPTDYIIVHGSNTRIRTYIHTCIRTYVHTYVHTYIHMCKHRKCTGTNRYCTCM